MKELANQQGLQQLVTLLQIFEILSRTTDYELQASRAFKSISN
jgi:hypothetical protein